MEVTIVSTHLHLEGILTLQQANLPNNISTPHFSHTIAIDHDKIIGYILTMTKDCRNDLPVLIPMFDLIDKLSWRGQLLKEVDFIIGGQVCITEVSSDNKRSLRAHVNQGFEVLHRYSAPDGHPWTILIKSFSL